MSRLETYWYAVIGASLGIIFALATGLIVTTPPMLVGAVWYGYPLAWLYRMIVAPQYNPWTIDYANLAYDLAFWIVIFVVILMILGLLRRRQKRTTTLRV
jgi:uncharacterized membrane protein